MALIFKSNKPYLGALSLATVEQVTMTPSELYDEYAARVTLDGGEIISPAATLGAIEDIQTAGLYGRIAVAASASWGVKLIGGRVSKLYALDGVDLLGRVFGAGATDAQLPLHDTSGAFPRVITDIDGSRFGGILQTESLITLASSAAKEFILASVQYPLDGLTTQHVFGNLEQISTGYFCALLGRTPIESTHQINGVSNTSAYDPLVLDAAHLISVDAPYGAADNIGSAIVGNISNGNTYLITDNEISTIKTSDTGELTDYVNLSRRLYVGSGFSASANITASRKGAVLETFVLKHGTVQEARSLTRAMTLRYA